jgi:hypothetical protein
VFSWISFQDHTSRRGEKKENFFRFFLNEFHTKKKWRMDCGSDGLVLLIK